MQDRQPTKPNRVKITFDDGTVKYGYIERADEPTVEGTALNKANLFDANNSERYACDVPSEAFELLTDEMVVFVPASGWSSNVDNEGYYTNQVTVEKMKEQYSPVISPVYDNADSVYDIESAYSNIKRVITFDGYVIFKSTELILTDLNIKLKGV